MHSSLIGKVEKANRYARELDRITVDRLSLTFRGDNDTHHVALDAGQWRCTCHYFESWGSCVHLLTLQKVMGVMLPEEAQVSIFASGSEVSIAIAAQAQLEKQLAALEDAVDEIPVMTFLAYRFIPASLIVALIFRRELRLLSSAGWRAG